MYVMYMVVSMHTCVIDVSLLSVCNSVTSDVIKFDMQKATKDKRLV